MNAKKAMAASLIVALVVFGSVSGGINAEALTATSQLVGFISFAYHGVRFSSRLTTSCQNARSTSVLFADTTTPSDVNFTVTSRRTDSPSLNERASAVALEALCSRRSAKSS